MRFPLLLAAAGLLGTTVACNAALLTSSTVPVVSLRDPLAPSTMPLVFVDGKRMAPGATLERLRALDIALIEVVKGSAAISLYGDEGRNGVIRIFTKSR